MRSRLLLSGFGCILIVLALVVWIVIPKPLQGLRFEAAGKVLSSKGMPWLFDMGEGVPFVAVLNVPGQITRLHLKPDDCVDSVTLGGQAVAIPSDGSRCDYSHGFDLEVPASTQATRELVVNGHNNGGRGGFNAEAIGYQGARDWAPWLFGAGALTLLTGVLLWRQWSWPLLAAGLGGTALRLWYWSYTPWDLRTHDVDGHIDYINILVQQHLVPPAADSCWQCYQPSFYYYFGAVTQYLTDAFDFQFASHWEVQLLSMLANIVFLLAGLSVLRKVLPGTSSALLFVFVFAFWPSMIVHSPRIGNDAFMYLFSALAFRSLMLWQQDKHPVRHALLASVCAALSLAAKTSGIVTCAVVVLTLASAFRPSLGVAPALAIEKAWPCLRNAMLCIGIIMLGFLSGPVYRYITGVSAHLLVANVAGNGSDVVVQSGPGNMLWFDLQSWISSPFTSPIDDAHGRTWFLNYAGKTGLFGEFTLLNSSTGLWLAALISLCALVIAILILRNLINNRLSEDLPWKLTLILSLLALAAMRLLYPLSCSNDARYILPVVLAIVILAERGARLPVNSIVLRAVQYSAIGIFSLCSILLFVAMGFASR